MKKQILVLDGGFATGLETYFQKNLTGDLWSASILLKDPDVIRKLHLLYYEAGADIAITCSYQASIDGFMKLGLSGMESETLIKKSVQLANEAKLEFTQKSGRKVLVAASLGSYGALLANGSEYNGQFGVQTTNEMIENAHLQKLQILSETITPPDVIVFETIPSIQEITCIKNTIQKASSNIPIWVSVSFQSERLNGKGESIEDTLHALMQIPKLEAIGMNCIDPNLVSSITKTIKSFLDRQERSDIRIICYPNSGEVWDPINKIWKGDSTTLNKQWSEWIHQWIDAGADVIGGCCRTGTSHISDIRKIVHEYEQKALK